MFGESSKIRVMLTTEGTYPFHQGGVSTWCDALVNKLPNVEYVVYSIMMNPYVTQKYTLPSNASLLKVPLWGTEEPSEHLATPFVQTHFSKKRTTDKIVAKHFLPLFQDLIEDVVRVDKNPLRFGKTLHELHRFFAEYDYQASFKAESTWNQYKGYILKYCQDPQSKLAQPSVFDLIQSLGWIYRFFVIASTPLPKVDVSHSAAAAFCGVPAVLGKLENKTPFLLTEHGIYLREQYLSLGARRYSSYLNSFLVRLVQSISALNYAYADLVTPVCQYNTRWERNLGVAQENIEVIYNGVDRKVFGLETSRPKRAYPTVTVVARIDPVKDYKTLLRAAALVRESIPSVRFIAYGAIAVPEYYQECLELRQALGLEENFIFTGHVSDVQSAYHSGDVVALSSITEGFPYSIVEAMMCGKAIVATDVGGVKEALAGCGLVVQPRQHEELGKSLLRLLQDPKLRATLGEEARKRALDYYTVERAVALYLNTYVKLAFDVDERKVVSLALKRQKLLAEKGYALAEVGYYHEALTQFFQAIDACPDSSAVPVLRAEMAAAYNKLGKFDQAIVELEKAEALMAVNGW